MMTANPSIDEWYKMSFLERRGMLERGFYACAGEIRIDPRSPKCRAVNQPENQEFYYGHVTSPYVTSSLLSCDEIMSPDGDVGYSRIPASPIGYDYEPTVPSYSPCTIVIEDDPIKEEERITETEEQTEEELAKLAVEIERLQKRKAEIEAISTKRARKF